MVFEGVNRSSQTGKLFSLKGASMLVDPFCGMVWIATDCEGHGTYFLPGEDSSV